jgi:predicted tellurium resistance membrane protein TerC
LEQLVVVRLGFFSWLREWFSGLEMLVIVILGAIGFFLWMLGMLWFFVANPAFNILWVPLPIVVAVWIRVRSEKKKSEVQKAEEELFKTKRM